MSSNVTISWERLWLYHAQASQDIQDDIVKQLDLDDFLPRIPVNVRKEVMRHAPAELKRRIESVIPLTQADETYKSELKRLFCGG